MKPPLIVTRVVNACVLLEMGEDAVLTDPYFDQHWFMRFHEPIGLKAAALPRLSAILGGHGVFDHWRPGSLSAYPFKDDTPVYVATPSMMKSARAAGFRRAEVVSWGERVELSGTLSVQVVSGEHAAGLQVNSYLLDSERVRVFVGTEARGHEPFRRLRATGPEVDVALLPIDGSAIFGRTLVMEAKDALLGAGVLGARTLIPIHYALKPVPLLLQTPGSLQALSALSKQPEWANTVDVVPLEPGQRWTWPGRLASGFQGRA